MNTKITTFYPKAFVVHVVDPTTGVVIHVSQLVSYRQVETVLDVYLDLFLDKVAERIEFDVKETMLRTCPVTAMVQQSSLRRRKLPEATGCVRLHFK